MLAFWAFFKSSIVILSSIKLFSCWFASKYERNTPGKSPHFTGGVFHACWLSLVLKRIAILVILVSVICLFWFHKTTSNGSFKVACQSQLVRFLDRSYMALCVVLCSMKGSSVARSKGSVSKTRLTQGCESAAWSKDSNEVTGFGKGVCSITTLDAVSTNSRTYSQALRYRIIAIYSATYALIGTI